MRNTWTQADRDELRMTMDHADHTTVDTARILHEQFAVDVTQETVSRWRSGRIDTPTPVEQIRAYVAAYGPGDDEQGVEKAGRESSSTSGQPNHPKAQIGERASDPFAPLAAIAAGQPLLGPEQMEFLQSLNSRRTSSKPMSKADFRTAQMQARILRLLGD